MQFRLYLLISGVFLAYASLVFNFYNLQLEKGSYYSARAESQYRLAGFLEPRRGIIYFTDKNNNPIPAAMGKNYPVIYAVPKEIQDPEEATAALSKVLKLDQAKVKNSLTKPNDLYELLLAKAGDEEVAKIKEAGIKGVYVDSQDFRFYPFGNLASHILGFVGPSDKDSDLRGRYGLEVYFDDYLRGRSGKIDSSAKGEKLTEAVDGKDLFLTIDRDIQARAEEILTNLIKEYGAVAGTVIVQEPKTGKILALGNYPAFDPNSYSEYPIKTFLNPAAEAVYEPGSIFKVFTMAAGIDSGKITPETKFYDSGSVTFNGKTIKNWDLKSHGWITMTETIEGSINTGAVFAQRKTGPDLFYGYLVNFGFDQPTGISLPGELKGSLNTLKKNAREINFATASFGQGVSVTPLELIAAVSAIANDGILMRPLIVADDKPEIVKEVITKSAADQVTGMMVSAVRKAQIAQIPNYQIAGKTGTAQVPDFQRGGYTTDVINTYAGFAPATDPKFTILIRIDKPKGAPLAGLTVVPAFRELAQFILNYYNLPPDGLKQ